MPSEELAQALQAADRVAEIVRSGRHLRPRIHHREGSLHYWTRGPDINVTIRDQGGIHEDNDATKETPTT